MFPGVESDCGNIYARQFAAESSPQWPEQQYPSTVQKCVISSDVN